jgi:uncharacterized protein
MNVLVIGASTNPERYSYKAIHNLVLKGHHVFAIGARPGNVDGIEFYTNKVDLKNIDTITLYINPTIQKEYIDYILMLNPIRVIFNPGTENPELELMLNKKGIETTEACTLVMLATEQF